MNKHLLHLLAFIFGIALFFGMMLTAQQVFGLSTYQVFQGGSGNTSFPFGSILTGNGTGALVGTSSNPLYVGSFEATNTAATSTAKGNVQVNKNFWVNGTSTLATTTLLLQSQNIVYLGQGNFASTTAGMQKAINYLSAYGGGTIRLGCGDFYFAAETITLKSHITIEGGPRDCTVIHQIPLVGISRLFIVGADVSDLTTDITFRNLYITNRDKYPLRTAPLDGTYAIAAAYTSHLTIQNVRTEMFATPISIVNSTFVLFDHNTDLSGYNGNAGGWGAQNHINAGTIDNLIISNNTSYIDDTAYRLHGVKHVSVVNNNIYYGSIELGNAEGRGYSDTVDVIGNHFHENVTNALNTAIFGEGGSNVQVINGYNSAVNNVHYIGNTFTFGNSQSPTAILFEAWSNFKFASTTAITNVEVANNTIISTSTVSTNGIVGMIQSGSLVNANIHDNHISGGQLEGIDAISMINSSIHDNIITDYNQGNCSSSRFRCAAIAVAANPSDLFSGTASSSINNLRIFGNVINSTTTNSIGIYVASTSLIFNLQIGENQILASSTYVYLNTKPVLYPSTFIGPVSASFLYATDSAATSSFAGHVGINLLNVPYPLMVLGGFKPYALSFAAASSLTTATTSIPGVGANMTLSFYAKPTLTPGSAFDGIGLQSSVADLSKVLSIRWTNDAQTFAVVKNNTIALAQTPNNTAPSGSWYQVVYTWDGTTNKLYINGAIASSSTTVHDTGVTNLFEIGQVAAANHWLGKIDNVRVWNTALTATQIGNMYLSYPNTPRTGMVGEWMFEEGTGSSVADTSGTGNTGTILLSNPSFTTDAVAEAQVQSIIADFTAPGSSTSTLRLYSTGQVDGGFFNATLATSTLIGLLIPQGNRLGIGTTSPYDALSVFGTTTSSLFNATSTGTSTFAGGLNLATGCLSYNAVCITQNAGTVTSVSGSGGTTGLTLTGGAITTSGTLTLGGTLAIANGGTATTTGGVTNAVEYYDGTRLTNGSGFVFDGTHVGIGVTNPAQLLQVKGGPIQVQSQTTAPNSYANRENVLLFNRNELPTSYYNKISSSWSATLANTTLNFELASADGSSASTVLTMNAAGNVGIGTTTPGTALSIAGAANITASATSTFYYGIKAPLFNATSTTASSTFANGINLTGGCFSINSNCLSFSTLAGTAPVANGGTGQTTFPLNSPLEFDGTNIVATSTSPFYVGSLVSTTTGNSSFAGPLGIGITSPARSLSIQKGDGSSNVIFGLNNTSGTEEAFYLVAGAAGQFISTSATNDVLLRAQTNLIFAAGQNGMEGMRISNNNGTTIGTAKIGFGTSTPWGQVSINPGAGLTGPAFVIGSSTLTQLILTQAGSFGIGTSTPGSPLSLNNLANFTLATSTFYSTGGINLTGGGCFALNAVCVNDLTNSFLTIPNGTNPTIDAVGKIGLDTTANQFLFATSTTYPAVVQPYYKIGFSVSTSSWVGTTTIFLGPADAAETFVSAQCETDAGTLNVSVKDGSSNRMDLLNASTTIGTFTFSTTTTNRAYTAGESRRVDVGTPASSPTNIGCVFKYVYDRQ